MQAKFTDAGESKHEVFALTYYVTDSDDNEKERFFPVKRLLKLIMDIYLVRGSMEESLSF